MHTGGEPVRIVVGGYPALPKATLLERRRHALEHHDDVRRLLMREPRGHFDMYGAVPLEADAPDADFAVLFLHNEGYSTMCGHAVIALGRWAVDSGRVAPREPETRLAIQCPCGVVRLRVEVKGGRSGRVRFESVPAFALMLERSVEVPGHGRLAVDIGYGGAFYAVLPASRLGLELKETPLAAIVERASLVSEAVRDQLAIQHPEDKDLGFLYGTILTDGSDAWSPEPSLNVCIFADRQVDRSPTGSGVTARIALQRAKGLIQEGQERAFESLTGARFTGRAIGRARSGVHEAVVVEVGGHAHYAGTARFTLEDDDPLAQGFLLR
ncbi:MAG: proline racemase family protein [Proteobacteria bacterium]|nr:proline racemase family protein [Pseudomonadota bacterium]